MDFYDLIDLLDKQQINEMSLIKRTDQDDYGRRVKIDKYLRGYKNRSRYNFRHDHIDPYVAGKIAAKMKKHGWVGAEAVIDGENLLTGHHRYVASHLAGIPFETIQLKELVDDEEDYQALANMDFEDWVHDYLDPKIVKKYGLDQ